MENKEFRNENGERHRLDGPAVEDSNGKKAWFVNGELHRLDGPAAEYSNGNKSWCVNGKCHRLDGPAIEYLDGGKSWWVNGEHYGDDELSLKEFLIYTKACKDFNGK